MYHLFISDIQKIFPTANNLDFCPQMKFPNIFFIFLKSVNQTWRDLMFLWVWEIFKAPESSYEISNVRVFHYTRKGFHGCINRETHMKIMKIILSMVEITLFFNAKNCQNHEGSYIYGKTWSFRFGWIFC